MFLIINQQKMKVPVENNYSYTLNLVLSLVCNSGFIELKDFGKLGNTDKYLNSIYKEHIEKYYTILRKCSDIRIQVPLPKFYNYNNDEISDYKISFEHNYWNKLFNKLNKDEMTFYLSYFILKYHKFYKVDIHTKYWSCLLYKDGFIKSLDSKSNRHLDNDTIILKIGILYVYSISRELPYFRTGVRYSGPNIVFQDNKGNQIYNIDFINFKLLKKLILSFHYNNSPLKYQF